MAIYEITQNEITAFEATSFVEVGLREREDLQRLLKTQVEVVCPDVLVIAEGFRDWEDSRRELDLLAVDKDGNLVVIELKRTEDAGHAELQAIRYAAMVSTMTFAKAVEVFGDYLVRNGNSGDPAVMLLEFLGWDEPDEDRFAQDVRIVLVAADFSRELTTSVMWLNERAMDIRCVRIRPYRDGSRLLADVQQVIPLPEAEDYMVRIREKAAKERQDRVEAGDRKAQRQEFWKQLLERAHSKVKAFANVSPCPEGWLSAGSGITGPHYQYAICRHSCVVRFIFEGEKATNKAQFDWLHKRKEELERGFGGPLEWYRQNDMKHSRFEKKLEGGYGNDLDQWPEIQDRMIAHMVRLEQVMSPLINQLRTVNASAESETDG